MKRLFVLTIAILVISAPAFANLLVNGDFSSGETGWTRWNSPWGGPFSWDASSGSGILQAGSGSFGWYQAITTVPGVQYKIEAMWTGDGGNNWIEILFFNDDGRAIYQQLDAPNNSSIITKVDGWGMNGGMPVNNGVPVNAMNGAYWFPSGPKTNIITATGTTMYVGLKTGSVGPGTAAWFDDVSVTAIPEPASILALVAGLGGLVIRRKR